jgi:hypothetical protein
VASANLVLGVRFIIRSVATLKPGQISRCSDNAVLDVSTSSKFICCTHDSFDLTFRHQYLIKACTTDSVCLLYAMPSRQLLRTRDHVLTAICKHFKPYRDSKDRLDIQAGAT